MTYDEIALELLLDSSITPSQRARILEVVVRHADREVGDPVDVPCDRCGSVIYERIDGDLLCGNCGLPYGEEDYSREDDE